MGFIKANKQINNFFRYVSLSCINFISLIQRTEILEEWAVCGFIILFFFIIIKLKYSAQAICSPRFPFIILPISCVFLQPGKPSSCPQHCSGSVGSSPRPLGYRGGCRARTALHIPVKQFSMYVWSRALWNTVIFHPSPLLSPWPRAEFLWAGQAYSY